MLTEYIQPLIHYLHAHPHLGWIIAYFIAFLESLAVIGTVIPGSVTMTAIGALMGAGVLPPLPTFIWAVLGAYTGDCLSYWFGIYYNDRLLKIWPFKKFPYLITKGETFFKKHGGKSIIIGRFAGPVRSLVPVIAGVLKMSPWRFLPFAFIAATIWALIYIIPGMILGTLSLELPASVATQFIIACLVTIALIWGITWLTKYFLDQMWGQVDRLIYNVWQYLNVHKNSHWITQILRNPKHEEDHQQLVVAFLAIVSFLIFSWILFEALAHGVLTNLNLPIYNLLQSIRIKSIDSVMIPLTLFGDVSVLLPVAAIMLLWLLWKRQWWAAAHWIAIVLISLAAIEGFNAIIDSPRPPLVAMFDSSSSFISSHVLLTWTLLSFMAMLIMNHLAAAYRSKVYLLIFCLVLLIAFSQLYLGSHWFTDVVGSFWLGCTILFFMILSYRRSTTKSLPLITSSILFIASLIFIWVATSFWHFKPLRATLTPIYQTQQTSKHEWWQQTAGQFPLYRPNRLGHLAQPLNVQWHGSLTTIQESLLKQGWQTRSPRLTLETTINELFPPKNQQHLPIIPMLYHGRSPVLLLIKVRGPNEPILMLRLWQSDIILTDTITPVWIGTVNYYQPPEKLFRLDTKQSPEYINAAKELIPFAKPKQSRMIEVAPEQQPPEIRNLQWDGKVLLIKTE